MLFVKGFSTLIEGIMCKISSLDLLKLATRAKFHLGTAHMMEMIIALDSSFREVQF